MNSENKAGPENNKPNLHVLVAEDDDLQRNEFLTSLESCGYKVSVASNGKFALEMLQRGETFDLVLLDLMMPEMDGLELLVFMQKDEKLKHIPVVMMSSDGEIESVAVCLQNGAKDYLIKPITHKNLEMLAQHVNSKEGH